MFDVNGQNWQAAAHVTHQRPSSIGPDSWLSARYSSDREDMLLMELWMEPLSLQQELGSEHLEQQRMPTSGHTRHRWPAAATCNLISLTTWMIQRGCDVICSGSEMKVQPKVQENVMPTDASNTRAD